MIGIIWATIMFIITMWAIKTSWAQEDKIGKGLYILLGLLSTWALYEIVMPYLTK